MRVLRRLVESASADLRTAPTHRIFYGERRRFRSDSVQCQPRQAEAQARAKRARTGARVPPWPLFDGHRLREVTRLVDVGALEVGHVIREELERDDRQERRHL